MHEMKETKKQATEESITGDSFIGPTVLNMIRKCRIANEEAQHKLSETVGELIERAQGKQTTDAGNDMGMVDFQSKIIESAEEISREIMAAQEKMVNNLIGKFGDIEASSLKKKLKLDDDSPKKEPTADTEQKQATTKHAKNPNGFHAKTNSQQNASKEQAQEETEDATASAAPTP